MSFLRGVALSSAECLIVAAITPSLAVFARLPKDDAIHTRNPIAGRCGQLVEGLAVSAHIVGTSCSNVVNQQCAIGENDTTGTNAKATGL